MGIKEDILQRISITNYYSQHVRWKNQHGTNWSGFCPFHDDKNTASFFLEVATGKWFCQGACGEGGDIFTFQQKVRGQNFNEALKDLAAEAHIEYTPQKPSPQNTGKKKSRTPKITEDVLDRLHDNLKESEEAMTYLESRGITREVMSRFRIGLWHTRYDDFIVFPIRKKGKLFTYRFKSYKTGKFWQVPQKEVGQDTVWFFPEPTDDQEIILCEGEYDSLSAISKGLNATNITGGAGTWRDFLAPTFKDRNVFVVYDIDEKGSVGAQTVANRVVHKAKLCKIVTLDLDREKYPNGDLNDFFVKEEKSVDDLKKLFGTASVAVVVPESVQVVEHDGCYWSVKEKRNGEPEIKQITNFTIRLNCRYRMQVNNETTRSIKFVSSSGRCSGDHIITAEDMASGRKFKSFCLSKGDFLFEGSEKDLVDIWYRILAQDPDAKEVFSAFKVGYAKAINAWLFENMTIRPNGNGCDVLLPDESGICWNGNKGYTFTPIETSGSDSIGTSPNLIITNEPTHPTVQNFCKNLVANVGTYDALIGVALSCGSIYYEEIIKKFGCFPILWVYGKLQCGKNEYCGFLMRMFGLGRQDNESIPGIRSTVPITRRLTYFGSIPSWFDEYRNSLNNIEMIKGILRSAYNAAGRSLGDKATFGVVKERMHSPVFISGEELPEDDEALLSRLAIVHLKKKYRQAEYYPDVFRLSSESSAHIYKTIIEKTPDKIKELIEKIEYFRREIAVANKSLNARVVLNYSIVLGCYSVLVNSNDPVFEDHVINGGCIDTRHEEEEQEIESFGSILLSDFVEDINVILSENLPHLRKIDWWKRHEHNGKQVIAAWMSPLYEEWSTRTSRKKGSRVVPWRTILDHMKETNYFIGKKSVKLLGSDENKMYVRKCILLNLDYLPMSIKSWFGLE